MTGASLPPPRHLLVLQARISSARLSGYLSATNRDFDQALRLYEWNVLISGAFFESLGQLEVLLRNSLSQQLSTYNRRGLNGTNGSGNWFSDPHMPLQPQMFSLINTAVRHVQQQRATVTQDRVIAELMFAFWRYLLDARHQAELWSPALRHAFPNLRPRVRQAVYDPLERLNAMRNRIAHHEPIHTHNLDALWHDLLTARCRFLVA